MRNRAMSRFDITAALRSICVDMTQRVPLLAHIDMTRVAVGYCQARKDVSHGLQASLTPLRFAGVRHSRAFAAATTNASGSCCPTAASVCICSTSTSPDFRICHTPRSCRRSFTSCGTSVRRSTATYGDTTGDATCTAHRRTPSTGMPRSSRKSGSPPTRRGIAQLAEARLPQPATSVRRNRWNSLSRPQARAGLRRPADRVTASPVRRDSDASWSNGLRMTGLVNDSSRRFSVAAIQLHPKRFRMPSIGSRIGIACDPTYSTSS